MRHLGNGSEFAGKDETAKRCYTQLYESFPVRPSQPTTPQRLSIAAANLVGNEMKLNAPLLNDASKTFDISHGLKGKVIIVPLLGQLRRPVS